MAFTGTARYGSMGITWANDLTVILFRYDLTPFFSTSTGKKYPIVKVDNSHNPIHDGTVGQAFTGM